MSNQDEMLDKENIAHNRFKRPHYPVGSRVRVVTDGPYHNWQGDVVDVRPLQRFSGQVATYYYTLRMDNLARQEWAEENLAPLTE